MDALRMPIIDIFKANLLKQKENAFKRSMKGSIERDGGTGLVVNED
jgi:hypothetical protein